MSTTTHGHCLCGDLRYAFEGEPLWVAHCHCESCRRQTSSAIATFVGVRREQFRYLAGQPAAYASSPGVSRTFCPRCGSPMAYESDGFPGEVHLYVGTLEDPAAVRPTGHVHTAHQLPWFEVHDDLPRFERTGRDGKPTHRGPRPTA